MSKLVFIRHGQSEWNLKNLFTGWTDVNLSENGVAEAKEAGRKLKDAGIQLDQAYTSVLKRAIMTLHYALEESDQLWIPEVKSWRLNERHYGDLQGQNKAEAAEKFGEEQVHILDPNVIPGGENLKVTLERVMPFWEDHIAPDLLAGKNVIVAAHGNSLRALTKYLEGISDDDIINLEIPTGQPIVYDLDENLKVVDKKQL